MHFVSRAIGPQPQAQSACIYAAIRHAQRIRNTLNRLLLRERTSGEDRVAANPAARVLVLIGAGGGILRRQRNGE